MATLNSITKYSLDEKRDTFARLVASGKDPAKAYNIAFNDILPDVDAMEKASSLCTDDFVIKKINQYYDDRRVLKTINRQDVAITLKRVIDVEAVDYYKEDEMGRIIFKPMKEWSRSMRTAFRGIKYSRSGQELLLYDKISAANALIGLMGWDKTPENNQKSNDMSNFSDEQLKELASNVEDAQIVKDE